MWRSHGIKRVSCVLFYEFIYRTCPRTSKFPRALPAHFMGRVPPPQFVLGAKRDAAAERLVKIFPRSYRA